MIALDTNLLVYAHRREMPFHDDALAVLVGLANGSQRWGIPWPCVHEFLGVVTNPRIFREPTPIELAFDAITALQASNTLEMLAEGEGYLDVLGTLVKPARIQGAIVHDARIAAICRFHGVSELWSADRDFTRFPQLKVRNPLMGR
jgi:toxin-antitoxin system PIN domain toxin